MSFDVKGTPSLHFTPERMSHVHTMLSALGSHDFARPGTGVRSSLLKLNSMSNALNIISYSAPQQALNGLGATISVGVPTRKTILSAAADGEADCACAAPTPADTGPSTSSNATMPVASR